MSVNHIWLHRISAGYSVHLCLTISNHYTCFHFRLAYGNFEDCPANSCLDVRDHRSSTPLSGAYYMNITDSCTMESNITKVGWRQKVADLDFSLVDTCLPMSHISIQPPHLHIIYLWHLDHNVTMSRKMHKITSHSTAHEHVQLCSTVVVTSG